MKIRHIRVLEYTVDCEDAEEGLKYLEHHLKQRFVKGIGGVGPLTIREAILGEFPEIIEEVEDGTPQAQEG